MTLPIAEEALRRDHEREHASAVRAMFDRIAPTYDTLNRVMSAGIDQRWRRRAVRELEVAPEGDVLDLCAGTMDLTRLVARAFPARNVVAADFAAHMLEQGRSKAPRAETVVADAMDLPFRDASFGAVICGFGIRNVSDVKRVAHNVRRVLAPGGVFVTLELFRPARGMTRLFHTAYARHVLPRVGGWVSGDRSAYEYLARSMGSFLTRAGYEELLREVGFELVVGEDQIMGVAAIVTARVPR